MTITAATTLRITAIAIVAVKARVGELALALVVPLVAEPPLATSLFPPPSPDAAVGDVTTVDTNVDPCETTWTVLVTGFADDAGNVEVDFPLTVIKPAAVLSPACVEEDEDEVEVVVVSVVSGVSEELVSTFGVNCAGGGVGVGFGVEDVVGEAPASVSPGVSGWVASMERSTSRNRI